MTTYISVDVEAASLVPNTYSLLSVGACVVQDMNIQFHSVIGGTETSDVEWEADTYDWWAHPDQEIPRHRLNALASQVVPYRTTLLNTSDDFWDWCKKLGDDNLMFVAWPASYDYPFIQLLFKATGLKNPFNYRTIDVKSYACGKLGLPFDASRDEFPEWFQETPEFPHDALSDAIAQAVVFNKLLEYRKE